jgi:hypothetical protein
MYRPIRDGACGEARHHRRHELASHRQGQCLQPGPPCDASEAGKDAWLHCDGCRHSIMIEPHELAQQHGHDMETPLLTISKGCDARDAERGRGAAGRSGAATIVPDQPLCIGGVGQKREGLQPPAGAAGFVLPSRGEAMAGVPGAHGPLALVLSDGEADQATPLVAA